MPEKLKAHLALLTVALIYGSNYIIAKDVMAQGYMMPNGFVLLRIITGAVLFFILRKAFISQKVEKKDYPYLALCGLLGTAINMLCFFKGLKLTSPIHASLIMITTPMLVLVLSALFLKEKITKLKLLGLTLGLGGAVLLVSQSGKDGNSSVLGDLFIFINALSYGGYLVLVKKMTAKYNPMLVISWVFFFGMFFVFPFGIQELMAVEWSSFPTSIVWAIVFVLLFTTFLAYLLNVFALSKVEASIVSFYIYFQPLIASLISISLGMDSLDIVKILSATLLFIGVYLVSKKVKPKVV